MLADKKLRIMQAAEQLFGSRRSHEITLDEIARAADVAKGTIYLYFSDKEDVIFNTALAGYDEMVGQLLKDAAQIGDFRDALIRTCGTIIQFFLRRRPLFRIILYEGLRAEEGGDLRGRWMERRTAMTNAVTRVISHGASIGVVRSDVPPEVLAEYLLGMLRTRSWELEGQPDEVRSHALLIDIFLHGAGKAPA